MRLSRLRTWDEQIDDTQDKKDELNKQILDTYEQLEKYQSWEGLEEYFRAEQAKEFVNIMNTDANSVLLARERAKVYNKILQRKVDLEKDLERLHSDRNALEE